MNEFQLRITSNYSPQFLYFSNTTVMTQLVLGVKVFGLVALRVLESKIEHCQGYSDIFNRVLSKAIKYADRNNN